MTHLLIFFNHKGQNQCYYLFLSELFCFSLLCLFREIALFDMASASSVQVVTVIEPLIQYSADLFPEGIQSHMNLFLYDITYQTFSCIILVL